MQHEQVLAGVILLQHLLLQRAKLVAIMQQLSRLVKENKPEN